MGSVIMTRKLSIPLPNADHYYDLLIQNEKTDGTNEQKMLVLRRRFDRILRDVTGPFSNSPSFYTNSMDAIKTELGVPDDDWAEYKRMKDSFNFLMHGDGIVTKKRYLQSLNRMSNFINLLTKVGIPSDLCAIIGKKEESPSPEKTSVFCCISSTSIPKKEDRDQFNAAASKFRNELLSDKRIKNKIRFTFLVTNEQGIIVRDMSDRPVGNVTPTKTPRETALLFATQELTNHKDGMLILLYGGNKLQLSDNIVRAIKGLNTSIQVYPISLGHENSPFEGFPYDGQIYQMIPGCYEEFFNWLYDSLILLYQ
jgi:hypothetical protein